MFVFLTRQVQVPFPSIYSEQTPCPLHGFVAPPGHSNTKLFRNVTRFMSLEYYMICCLYVHLANITITIVINILFQLMNISDQNSKRGYSYNQI